jgi:3'-phosphoadenosine 5'-phosphosulfate sulfotransferase (PAPS reductase)/FAD synthetase
MKLLNYLEEEAIYIIREVAAQFQRPSLLFSGGKDSIVLSYLAKKAFYQGQLLLIWYTSIRVTTFRKRSIFEIDGWLNISLN